MDKRVGGCTADDLETLLQQQFQQLTSSLFNTAQHQVHRGGRSLRWDFGEDQWCCFPCCVVVSVFVLLLAATGVVYS